MVVLLKTAVDPFCTPQSVPKHWLSPRMISNVRMEPEVDQRVQPTGALQSIYSPSARLPCFRHSFFGLAKGTKMPSGCTERLEIQIRVETQSRLWQVVDQPVQGAPFPSHFKSKFNLQFIASYLMVVRIMWINSVGKSATLLPRCISSPQTQIAGKWLNKLWTPFGGILDNWVNVNMLKNNSGRCRNRKLCGLCSTQCLRSMLSPLRPR